MNMLLSLSQLRIDRQENDLFKTFGAQTQTLSKRIIKPGHVLKIRSRKAFVAGRAEIGSATRKISANLFEPREFEEIYKI